MKKKKFCIAMLSLFFTLLFAAPSFAASVNETEPNNSSSEAQLIQRNNEDPSKVVNGNRNGQYVAVGTFSDSNDEDWYKVYLPASDKTILGINTSKISVASDFDIYDENLNLVKSISYVKDPSYLGPTPYYIDIPNTGYYYIRVHSNASSGEYRFYIGGPDYSVDTYTYNATNALTITPTITSVQTTYDFSNIDSIPTEAIVYHVTLDGTRTNFPSSEERSIKLASDSSWITTPEYTYDTDVPVSSSKHLKNPWIFKLDGSVSKYTGSYKLVPQITFRYIYPVLPN
ncbi:MAG: hypothetical protein LKF87_10210 [Clostridium tyrobutyricum]|jgi:hypothetical protein|uniref:hypothetical protein n=1 Tax=Clostridium tyrobutyricum TaxID=1519 RepID=UPI00242B4C73|nr:hypothetical protein [Clostridium tyrobutyricum]MCH4200135.1 hypothetical protein [Clostridium tyrobutyricum]MCH4259323.1 hypothetical protein [Clostridium tyrobutyricum]